ncbi:MAG: zinc-binding dehydrogenase [Alphaproteobacteria bacterium]
MAIEVHAAGVNFPDLLVTRGAYQILAPLPFSPGKEVAGVIADVGDGVSEFRRGDRVLAYIENGGYVDRIITPSVLCNRMPQALDFADAIGLGLACQTAHFALFERGMMQRGETVLVTGATGGVGVATIAVAKACGARVIAGCMSADKIAFAREQGADVAILLDRPDIKERLRAEVAEATGGAGADVIVENLGGAVFEACLRRRLVRPHRRRRFRGRAAGGAALELSADQEHRRDRIALERLPRAQAGARPPRAAGDFRAVERRPTEARGDRGAGAARRGASAAQDRRPQGAGKDRPVDRSLCRFDADHGRRRPRMNARI